MRYIDQWLSGLGLDHIIPLLQEHGITTPNKLAQLSLRDMYEVVGVNDAEDRKKLYFLIQRLQTILKKGSGQEENEQNEQAEAAAAPPQHATHSDRHSENLSRQGSNLTVSPLRPRPLDEENSQHSPTRNQNLRHGKNDIPSDESEEGDYSDEHQEEEESSDLRVLRRQHQGASPQRNVHQQPSLSIAVNRPQHQTHDIDPHSQVQQRSGRLSAPAVPQQHQKVLVPHSVRAPSPIHVEESISHSGRNGQIPMIRNAQQRPPSNHHQAHYSHEDLSDPAELEEEIPPPPAKSRFVPTKSTPQMTIRKPVKLPTTPSRHSIAASQPYQQSPKLRNYRGRSQSPPPSPPPTPPPEDIGHSHRRAQSDYAPTHRQPTKQNYNPSYYEQPEFSEPAPAAASRRSVVSTQNQKGVQVRSTRSGHTASQQYVETSYKQTSTVEYYDSNVPQHYPYGHAQEMVMEEEDEEVQDMAIRVIVKKRPLNRLDGKGDKDVLEIRERGHVIVHEPKTKVDLTKVVESTEFFFDDAFTEMDTNEAIYSRAIRPLVKTALDGGKGSCFAYGQTGSGKVCPTYRTPCTLTLPQTFTMMGSNPSAPAQVKSNAGLYVLAARDIFRLLEIKSRSAQTEPSRNYQVMVSCFEIYGGKLFDLLNERGVIRCLEDSKQQVQLPGLTEHKVNDVSELLSMMARAHEQRSTGSTGANLESSRSHQVLQLSVQISTIGKNKKPTAFKKYGQLSFIDLAGSERGADTTNNSKQTRMEGAEINTSLLALKEVIRSLEKKHGHTPFRGSKLTQVLKDSFIGDKTRTCMVACVSPNMCNCEHTLNTLRYADRVKEHQSQSQPQAGHAAGGRAKFSDPIDEFGGYRGDSQQQQRPVTAQQYQTRDDLMLESNLYHARPSTAYNAPALTNRRASLDRPGSSSSAMQGGNNYPPPQPVIARASSIGATAMRRPSHKESTQNHSTDEYAAPSRNPPRTAEQQGPRQGSIATPIQSKGKRLEQGSSQVPLSQRTSVPNGNSGGIRLLRGGNNDVVQNSRPSGNYEMDPYQSMGKLPPPPPPEMNDYDDNGSHFPLFPPHIPSDNFDEEDFDFDEDHQEADVDEDRGEDYDEGEEGYDYEENEEYLPADVEETDEPVIFDYDKSSSMGETLMLQKTVDLVSAHKLAIAEMVEVMKEEMELVQTMEQAPRRDSHSYVSQMDQILVAKLESINALRMELKSFQKYRMEVRSAAAATGGHN